MPQNKSDKGPRFSLGGLFRTLTACALLLGVGVALGGPRLVAVASEVLALGLLVALTPVLISLLVLGCTVGLRRVADALASAERQLAALPKPGRPGARQTNRTPSSRPADSAD